MGKKSSLEVELELVKIDNQFLKQQETISLKEANNLFLKADKEVKSIEKLGNHRRNSERNDGSFSQNAWIGW